MGGLECELEVQGLDELQAKLQPELFGPPIREAMTKWALDTEARAKQYAPKDTGSLARSITHELAAGTIPLQARVYTKMVYASVMEHGRRPGAKMPPSGVLLGWMRRHGIPQEMEFVLRRSIGRKGITARKFFSRAIKESQRRAEGFFNEASRKIEEMWGR